LIGASPGCRYDAARTIQAFSVQLRQQIELDT
jgi:hypothetical protein